MGQWQSSPVCNTPSCVHAASYVLQNLAPNWAEMDPCTDFDKMVCYGTYEHNGDDSGTFTKVRERTDRILRTIFESSSSDEALGVKSSLLTARSNIEEYNFDMLRTAYQACMNADPSTAAAIEPLQDLIISVNKTWPVSPTDLKTKVGPNDLDSLTKASLLLEKLDIPVFHGYCNGDDGPIMADFMNSVLYLPAWLYYQSDITTYLDKDKMKSYAERLGKVFAVSYPDVDSETAADLGKAVVSFEMELVQTALAYEEANPPLNDDFTSILKNVSVSELPKVAPAFGFDKLVAGLTPPGKTPSLIILESHQLWPLFSKVVSNHSRAAVQGWMVWKTIMALLNQIDSDELFTALKVEMTVDRWELCVMEADTTLRHIKDHYFISSTYVNQTMQAAERVTDNIRIAFKERLEELDWMSDESRKRAIQKADNILENIGYPKSEPVDLLSSESVAAYYDGLNFTTTNRLSNVLAARRFNLAKAYARVDGTPNRRDMANVADVNAYYNPKTNAIVIPAGISQLPFFHYHLPDYALYGGLGSIIGHEITHGFDNRGRTWNENAEHRSWWDNATVAAFEKRAQCFVDQYSEFEYVAGGEKIKVEGELTLGENLSDAGGLRAAYRAWTSARESMPDVWDQQLPGLEGFTSEQLFFIYHANLWCSTKREHNPADPHAPDMVRIRGMTENSKEFREAFKCKGKKPKCELF
ncbi:hypothetical protein C7999DRAFT_42755 [Corynascus novoguineensis]|uniref:Uncharacterized protein n=1 Tax=Corynascus novoguineensis TaxID=1126955 RepID=A0AAN7HN56_9PEZI|nr:hypothetical protein C7999DRAFT_42755 [Corynascus novoguineensis]